MIGFGEQTYVPDAYFEVSLEANGNIDLHHYFSSNCSATSVEEQNANKGLLKVTGLLGREKKQINHSFTSMMMGQ